MLSVGQRLLIGLFETYRNSNEEEKKNRISVTVAADTVGRLWENRFPDTGAGNRTDRNNRRNETDTGNGKSKGY